MIAVLRLSLARQPVPFHSLSATRTPPSLASNLPSRTSSAVFSHGARKISNVSTSGMKPKTATPPAVPRPSATVIVVNSLNEVLLVHRNPKSTSFANAHVFPGGNYDKRQDNDHGLPFTAIRELFEESGLLLAHPPASGIIPSDAQLDAARVAIHAQKSLFSDFLTQHGLRPNVEALLPFTQWITPPMIPKRFQTQFYIAFLPSSDSDATHGAGTGAAGFSAGDKQERLPTPDGGQEVVAARFVHPAHALAEFAARTIALFPPQFYLLRTLADLLGRPGERGTTQQRARVEALAVGAFGRMVINPRPVRDAQAEAEGWKVLAYEGDEAHGTGAMPGRRHRSRLKFGPGGSASEIVLERNFDIFTEIEERVSSTPKL